MEEALIKYGALSHLAQNKSNGKNKKFNEFKCKFHKNKEDRQNRRFSLFLFGLFFFNYSNFLIISIENALKTFQYYSGYTAFSLELTGKLKFDAENILVVKLDSKENLSIPSFGNVIDYIISGFMRSMLKRKRW